MTTAITMAILILAWAIYYGLQEVADAIRETKEKE
jgi:hypothetical protein